MKDVSKKLIPILKEGFCTPQISRLAKKLHEPATTLQYNIKKLEKEGTIKTYKAVFDYKNINEGFCAFVFINISPEEYKNPEKIGKILSEYKEVESVDVCTGDWELFIKVRTKDQEGYYNFMKSILSEKGIVKVKEFTSLKQIKTEFVKL